MSDPGDDLFAKLMDKVNTVAKVAQSLDKLGTGADNTIQDLRVTLNTISKAIDAATNLTENEETFVEVWTDPHKQWKLINDIAMSVLGTVICLDDLVEILIKERDG